MLLATIVLVIAASPAQSAGGDEDTGSVVVPEVEPAEPAVAPSGGAIPSAAPAAAPPAAPAAVPSTAVPSAAPAAVPPAAPAAVPPAAPAQTSSPPPKTAAVAVGAVAVSMVDGPTPGPDPWWLAFENSPLQTLIEEALSNRSDLKAVILGAKQKRVASTGALAPILPQVGVDVTGAGIALEALDFQSSAFSRSTPTLGPIPIAGQVPGFAKDAPPLIYYTGNAYLTGGIRIDAGKTVMNFVSLTDEANASLDDSDALAAEIAYAVASNYFDLLAAYEQVAVVQSQIAANQSVLDLVQRRFNVGEAPKLEFLQQQQQVASAESQLPAARSQLRVLHQRLSVTVGRAVQDEIALKPALLPTLKPISAPPELVDGQRAERISEQLGERPDVRAATSRVDAARAREVSAMLGFLPSIGLGASVGPQARYITDFDYQPLNWNVGLSLSIPIFQGGQNIANYRGAMLATEAAKKRLHRLRLVAEQFINQALVREDETRQQLAATTREFVAARAAFDESQIRYAAGLANYQAVLIALNASYRAELGTILLRRQALGARLDLVHAHAGPWTELLHQRDEK